MKDKFNNIEILRVKNGFIVYIDREKQSPYINEEIYVFNNLQELSEFINRLDNEYLDNQ